LQQRELNFLAANSREKKSASFDWPVRGWKAEDSSADGCRPTQAAAANHCKIQHPCQGFELLKVSFTQTATRHPQLQAQISALNEYTESISTSVTTKDIVYKSLTMDVSDVTPQLDQLEEELNKAQQSLEPLLGDIGDISSKLPLLDKAKLYVLVSYTIESLLFCESCSFLLLHSH
jgi:septal ring factor EnvC (AmiA/AmiB activator)